MRKAVFFDRDGVLNVDTGYVHRIEDLQWIQGARETVAWLKKNSWLIIVVTNQSGVARGYYSENDVKLFHRAMNRELEKNGGWIDDFFYCPDLPGAPVAKYNKDSDWRKPKPGMILAAMRKYDLSPQRCFLYGDGERDIQAAEAAGIQGFLFKGGNLYDFVRQTLPDLKD